MTGLAKNKPAKTLKASKLSNMEKKNKAQLILMLLPSIVLLVGVSIYPVTWVLKYAFFRYDGYTDAVFIGFDNFIRIFTEDGLYWRSVLHSFEYMFGKVVFLIPISLTLAIILNKNLPGKNLFQMIFYIPTIVSSSIASLIFYFIYTPYNGVLNNFLQQLGLIKTNVDWLGNIDTSMMAIIVVSIWLQLGTYLILFLAGLQSISKTLYESSKIDGANEIQDAWYITLPMLGPVFKVIMMLAIINTLKEFNIVLVMTNGGPLGRTELMNLYLYKLLFGDPNATMQVLNFGYGAAVGVVNSIIIGLLTVAYLAVGKKLDEIY